MMSMHETISAAAVKVVMKVYKFGDVWSARQMYYMPLMYNEHLP